MGMIGMMGRGSPPPRPWVPARGPERRIGRGTGMWNGDGRLWNGDGRLWNGDGRFWNGDGRFWNSDGQIWNGDGRMWSGGSPSSQPSPARGEGARAPADPSSQPSPARGEGARTPANPSSQPSPARSEGVRAPADPSSLRQAQDRLRLLPQGAKGPEPRSGEQRSGGFTRPACDFCEPRTPATAGMSDLR